MQMRNDLLTPGFLDASIAEGARSIPVAAEVDVVVVGGTTWGVSAAASARRAGASVYLVAPRSYLGDDLCGTLRLALEPGESPTTTLGRALFPDGRTTTPLHVKKVLDQALLDAGVGYIFGSYATDLVTDAAGSLCGVVMANRAGRQAVLAKVIVDATGRAAVARLAGAASRPWPTDETVTFERTVLVPGEAASPHAITRRLPLALVDGSYRALAQAEQQARDATYVPGQLRSAESLFFVPPDPIVGQRPADAWRGGDGADLGHFRPRGTERLYVVSGCADVPRDVAAELLRPAALMGLADRVGRDAAQQARQLPAPGDPRVQAPPGGEIAEGQIMERLNGLRPSDRPRRTIASGACGLKVLGRWDVIVAGGGTAGAAAAIAAARQGRSVLVIEHQEALGGIGTVGLVTRPYHGLKIGFAAQVPFQSDLHGPEHKMEWLRRTLREAGGEIWLGCACIGACIRGNVVQGVVVATPEQRGVVLGRVIIDATGNADVAIAAGSDFLACATEDGELAVQGVGLPPRPLNKGYVNTDFVLTDDSDLVDCWTTFIGARQALDDTVFDSGSMVQSRERRRIVGDFVMTYLDQVIGRTYSDSVVLSASDYDTHSYPSGTFFSLIPHDEESRTWNHPAPGGTCLTPYRCLLPRRLEGILVIGLGISIQRDATALIRMQYDLLNQGHAAGLAAAMAVQAGVTPRGLNLRELQRRLVAAGALPAEVLSQVDNVPFDAATIAEAVRNLACNARPVGSGAIPEQTEASDTPEVPDVSEAQALAYPGQSLAAGYIQKMRRRPAYDLACRSLAIVLAHADAAKPGLRDAFAAAQGPARLFYARVLCMLGEPTAVPELIEALREAQWDDKIFQGRMAEYAHLYTPVDGLVLALGATRDLRAVPAIVEKLDQLDAATTLSHHRAVASALEQIADPAAAAPLARLLSKPGMSGHQMPAIEPLYNVPEARRRREGAIRELLLARSLFRCGDHDGLAAHILGCYRTDLRGLLAQHAAMVLGD